MSTALFLVTETVQSHCSSAECWEVSHRYRIIALYECLVLVFQTSLVTYNREVEKGKCVCTVRILENRKVLKYYVACVKLFYLLCVKPCVLDEIFC